MKVLVVVLAILAGLKVWTQQSLHRAASEQALLKAYGSAAISSCQRTTAKEAEYISNLRKSVDWSTPQSAKVIIGDDSVEVSIWQVDHKDWDRRFKTPYIHLTSGAATRSKVCVFNVFTGQATLPRA